MISALTEILPWAVITVLAFNMTQRRFMAVGVGKRFATFQIGALLAALWAATLVLEHFRLPDLLLVPVIALLAVIAVARRRSIFPHRLKCAACGAPLPLARILYHDEPRCASCADSSGDAKEPS
jgi:hypothetical protein